MSGKEDNQYTSSLPLKAREEVLDRYLVRTYDDRMTFMSDVALEMRSVIRGRGPLTTDLIRASLILAEESGEVCAGALQCTREWATTKDQQDLYAELTQLVSVAIQLAANVRATIREARAKEAQ